MRVSVNTNEYRTILFAVDNDNIILSKSTTSEWLLKEVHKGLL